MNYTILYLFPASVLFAACGGDRQYEYYQNGNIKSMITVLNGVQNGKSIYYYENGNKRAESHWKNGAKTGIERVFYQNGVLMAEVSWQNGVKDGISKFFYDSGEILKIKEFKGDVLHGISEEYYLNGEIHRKGTFFQGLLDGIVSVYDTTGHQIEEKEYVIVYRDKSLVSELNTFKFFDNNGNIIDSISNYFTISSESDTVSLHDEYSFEVELIAPFFKGDMYVLLGKIDQYYKLQDMNIDTIHGTNFRAQCKVRSHVKGKNTIWGIIADYNNQKIIMNNDTVAWRLRHLYFRKDFFVKAHANRNI